MYPFNNKKIASPPILCWDIYANECAEENKKFSLPIGGFIKQSLIDYPGNIAAVIFTQGCNFKCFYCHNPELVKNSGKSMNNISWEFFFGWLVKNYQLLDAIVVTGGEPTIHGSLPCFLKKIKCLKLKVKLDTNGTNPEMLKTLIADKLVDYIAMDIKSELSLKKYQDIVGNDFQQKMLSDIIESKELIENSGMAYEFRTTLIKPHHTSNTIKDICSSVSGNIFLQTFINSKTLNKSKSDKCEGYTENELQEIVNDISTTNATVKVR